MACFSWLSANAFQGGAAALLTIGAIAAAVAEDWPEFRGPSRQGISTATGLPLKWSAEENVRWKAEIAGTGWSSPAVVKGKIHLTTAVPLPGGKENDRSLRAVCLAADTGATVWDVELFKQEHDKTDPIHNKNTHASPTPIVDGDRIYVHFGTQGTACLSSKGDVLWRNSDLAYHPQHGNGGSPALSDGILVICCDGSDVQFVVGLDAATGKTAWKKDRPPLTRAQKFSFSTPLVIEVNGRRQAVCPGTNAVVAYDPATGDEIWKVNYTGYSVIPRPVFGHGLVYLATGYGTPSLLAIKPDGVGDVTETHVAWTSNRGIPHTPSLLLVGDELYCVSDGGIASCFDAKTGESVWTKRIGGGFSASPLYAEGRIYLQDETGHATVIRAAREFEELAKNVLPGRTLASYGVVDKAFLIRTDSALYRIEN